MAVAGELNRLVTPSPSMSCGISFYLFILIKKKKSKNSFNNFKKVLYFCILISYLKYRYISKAFSYDSDLTYLCKQLLLT